MIRNRETTCRSVRHLFMPLTQFLTVFSSDGGHSGLSALYIGEETFSRLQFDIGSEDEIRPCDHCDLFMGSGPGAYVQRRLMTSRMNGL